MKIDDPRFDPMWDACGQLNMPVAIHISDPAAFFTPTDRFNERYEELNNHPDWSFYGGDFPSNAELIAARNRMFARHPKTQFVTLHFGNFSENLQNVAENLDRFPNMHVDMAARIGELGRQPFTSRRSSSTSTRTGFCLRPTRRRMVTSSRSKCSTISCMRSTIAFWKPRTNTSTTLQRRYRRKDAGGFTVLTCLIRFCVRSITTTPRDCCESRCEMLKRIAVLGLLFSGSLAATAQVRVWQATLTLPTYEEGLPDPNPPFDQFTTNRFNYPYTLRTNLTSRRVDHAWRAIYLENEYLKCSVLPDIGGHLYTCLDKISGKPMFYANPSIKKAAIAYRGAWAAFGVEFNFPVSHNWVTMSPVNFAFSKHEDGSASVSVGNIDRVYGMEWTVELVLRPKSTLLEQRVTLSNRSDVRHRFYWWNNAGVEAWDDTRIEYPMRYTATHGFTEVHPWPVDTDGVDYSIVRNHLKGPVSMFSHGNRENFMGVWNPHTNTGTVHFAEYDEVPAKKIWSWGVDADGLDWRKALSDNNSGYLEVQAGLFRNQETYAFLEPRQVIHFSEYWMPVREIGGISRANLAGVASLSRKANSLRVGFNANQAIPQASVSILKGSESVLHEKVDLVPEHAWTHEVPTVDAQAKYTLEIQDAKGRTLLRQTEGEYDSSPESEIHVGPQPSYRTPEPDQRSVDDWIQLGKDDELNGRNLDALENYKASAGQVSRELRRRESGRPSGGWLACATRRPSVFLSLFIRETPPTPRSPTILGWPTMASARPITRAHPTNRLRACRHFTPLPLCGWASCWRDRATSAGQSVIFPKPWRSAPDDLRVREELVAIRAAAGKSQEARALAQEGLTRFPLSSLLREELGDPDLAHLANDASRVLNLAAEYMRLGLYQKAVQVLSRKYPPAVPDQSEPGALAPSEHPMVAYFLAYCREKLGQSASDDYTRASKLSTAFVFPNTAEEYTVLRAALRAKPFRCHCALLAGNVLFRPRRDGSCPGRMGRSAQVWIRTFLS